MKNTVDYGSLNVHPGVFSLDKFIESDAPGTLSWLNMEENYQDNDILPFKEVECSLVAPPFDGSKMNKAAIPCRSLCAGCKRWQIESSDKTNLPEINNPVAK
ncbi:MAG TPA: hypothetical protein VIZ28_20180 [Chitinophagaceae bacterium]